MATASKNKLVFKIVESVGWIIGPMLFVLCFFSFKASKSGVYYETASEWGMAVGVLFVSIAFVARQWQK